MGADAEGAVGEEAAGDVGDAEDDSDVEGGECAVRVGWVVVVGGGAGADGLVVVQRGHGRGWKKFPR